MTDKRSIDYSKKSSRAVYRARIGMNLLRAALFWPMYAEHQRLQLEHEIRTFAPGTLGFFHYTCRAPTQEARQTIVSEVADRYENVMEYAARENPWFMAEIEDLRQEFIRYQVSPYPGIPVLRGGSA